MPTISTTIDLHARRAAIDALEAQRAAYHRFARLAESQQGSLASGDVEVVAAFTDGAVQTVRDLDAGARRVRSLVDHASHGASPAELIEIERQVNAMMTEARSAETSIRNLTTQLEAWRDAYGRQLTELGLTPGGGTATGAPDPTDPSTRRSAYARPSTTAPSILNRMG